MFHTLFSLCLFLTSPSDYQWWNEDECECEKLEVCVGYGLNARKGWKFRVWVCWV